MELLNRVLEWLEKHLPGLILAFKAGLRTGIGKKEKLEKKMLQEQTERKLAEGRLKIVTEYLSKSSSDTLDALIGDGDRLISKVSDTKTSGQSGSGEN